jgi:chitinase
MKPEEIPVESLTHLIFSFGFVAPNTFMIQPMPGTEAGLFTQITNVKKKNPRLKVLIALGVRAISAFQLAWSSHH